MAFRFKLGEPIEKGFRRIGADQIERARAQIAAGADPVTEVHEARKAIKRVRALLRLGREGLGEAVFQTENARFRAIAVQLAPARDTHVINATLIKLAADAPADLAASIARFKEAAIEGGNGAQPLADVARPLADLERAQNRFRRLRLSPDTFDTIQRGMVRNYRRARKLAAAAYEERDDETFHSWRKGVQAYWRHMQLLSRAWPEQFDAGVAVARELSQILGDDHDLALLAARLAAVPDGALAEADRRVIEHQIRTRQERLRRAAHPRGALIFAETPKAFGRRIGAIWHAGVAKHSIDAALVEREEGAPPRPAARSAAGK